MNAILGKLDLDEFHMRISEILLPLVNADDPCWGRSDRYREARLRLPTSTLSGSATQRMVGLYARFRPSVLVSHRHINRTNST